MTTTVGARIAEARKAKGWTQEELAEQTNLTVRTIQRLENQANTPRLHTLRLIAQALAIPFERINVPLVEAPSTSLLDDGVDTLAEERHSLQLLNLSSLFYLLIPFGHFLLPLYLLRKQALQHKPYRQLGWQIVKTQLLWNAGTTALMLLTVLVNVGLASRNQPYSISYFIPFVAMYVLNGWLIYRFGKRIISA